MFTPGVESEAELRAGLYKEPLHFLRGEASRLSGDFKNWGGRVGVGLDVQFSEGDRASHDERGEEQ